MDADVSAGNGADADSRAVEQPFLPGQLMD